MSLIGRTYTDVVTYADVATHMGVQPASLRRSRKPFGNQADRVPFPDPDHVVGQTPLWKVGTIENWLANRPSAQKARKS